MWNKKYKVYDFKSEYVNIGFESEAIMFEMFSLVLFGLIVYTFLVIVPTIVERVSSEEFRAAYFKHLASRFLNSYGK